MTIAFPHISEEKRIEALQPRRDQNVRVVIDTDMANEIDDQFALMWALLSQDILQIEGLYAAPFSFQYRLDELKIAYQHLQSGVAPAGADAKLLGRYRGQIDRLEAIGVHPRDLTQPTPAQGEELSYEEILTVGKKMNMDLGPLTYRGSNEYLSTLSEPIVSPAAEHLIERALAPDSDGPLYVAAIGCLTNVASAMLMAPEIIERIVVIWTAGYPSTADQPNFSFNTEQDMLASSLIFDSGVPLVYLPGFHIGAQLRLSLPEMEAWVKGRGEIGDYLYHLYTHNPIHPMLGINDHYFRTWVIWDMINIAWLLNPGWTPTELVSTPMLAKDKRFYQNDGRHLMREAYAIDRDEIFRDCFAKLEGFAANGTDV